VAAVHADYRAAGATAQTTNTYAIHRDRLEGTGLEDRFADLIAAALTEALGSGRIAGSIGPLIASYRPDIHPAHDIAVPAYAEVAALIAPRVDLFLCETVASVAHARAVLAATLPLGKPVWLSVTLDDEDGSRLRSGEPVADVLEAAQGASALLANCSAPEAMAAAMAAFAKGDLPFGAYANGFTQITKDFLKASPRSMRCPRAVIWGPMPMPISRWAGLNRVPPSSAAVARSAPPISRDWRRRLLMLDMR